MADQRPLPSSESGSMAFATYFDRNFLTRGLALLRSLHRQAPAATCWVLCLDDTVWSTLTALNLPNARLVHLTSLEQADSDLLAVKPDRRKMDYLYTITAPFLRYVYSNTRARYVLYVDADVYFFGPPASIIEELGENAIGIIDHRYPSFLQSQYRWGIFNVGIVAFQRSASAKECLEWWRERSLEWCYDRLEGDRYGEQKYLERWPLLFTGVKVLSYPGSGLGTWNVPSHTFQVSSGELLVDEQPLTNYHFSKFRILNRWIYDSGVRWYGYPLDPIVEHYVYRPYAQALQSAMGELGALTPSQSGSHSLALSDLGNGLVSLRDIAATIRRGGAFIAPGSQREAPPTQPKMGPSQPILDTR